MIAFNKPKYHYVIIIHHISDININHISNINIIYQISHLGFFFDIWYQSFPGKCVPIWQSSRNHRSNLSTLPQPIRKSTGSVTLRVLQVVQVVDASADPGRWGQAAPRGWIGWSRCIPSSILYMGYWDNYMYIDIYI